MTNIDFDSEFATMFGFQIQALFGAYIESCEGIASHGVPVTPSAIEGGGVFAASTILNVLVLSRMKESGKSREEAVREIVAILVDALFKHAEIDGMKGKVN